MYFRCKPYYNSTFLQTPEMKTFFAEKKLECFITKEHLKKKNYFSVTFCCKQKTYSSQILKPENLHSEDETGENIYALQWHLFENLMKKI